MGAMNRTLLLALGVVATVVASFLGLVVLPQDQLLPFGPFALEGEEPVELRPLPPFGDILHGRQVYIDLGCIYCHSQQVRAEEYGTDIARGWGPRPTVPRDYFWDDPPLLGTMRTGPDLANIGARQPNAQWHYLHLYEPEITSPGSIMPPHPFLFEAVPAVGEPPRDALELPATHALTGRWVVPNERGRQLVAYLLSLDHTYPVPEVPNVR
jgi:cytochrome c oxidase cbb3-type subunit 2